MNKIFKADLKRVRGTSITVTEFLNYNVSLVFSHAYSKVMSSKASQDRHRSKQYSEYGIVHPVS